MKLPIRNQMDCGYAMLVDSAGVVLYIHDTEDRNELRPCDMEIVRMVNSHDALLEACEALLAATDESGDTPFWGGHPSVDTARAAIARATGKAVQE